MEVVSKNQERTYTYNEACVFRKTKEAFGGLSNMASGFQLNINGITILSSEALYQACRFPHLPEVQKKIISERSPMTAKMVGKPFRDDSRPDWDLVRKEIMYWCLRVKLAQHFISFGQLLNSTQYRPIVEESTKDPFWGAMKSKEDETILVGVNALGRLLMRLRECYYNNRYDFLYVHPLNIPNFLLLGEPICAIDERAKFIDYLSSYWGLINPQKSQQYDIAPLPTTIVEERDKKDVVQHFISQPREEISIVERKTVNENVSTPSPLSTLEKKICKILHENHKALTAKEIITGLTLDWNVNKMSNFLKKADFIKVSKGKNGNLYNLRDSTPLNGTIDAQSRLF